MDSCQNCLQSEGAASRNARPFGTYMPVCKEEPKTMYRGWYLKNKELKPCMMMDLLSLWEKGGPGGCSLADAAQGSLQGEAGGRSCASPAGFASR